MKTFEETLIENWDWIKRGSEQVRIIDVVRKWLQQKQPKTASSEYEHGRWELIEELLEELDQK